MEKAVKNLMAGALMLWLTPVSGQKMDVADFDRADFHGLETFTVVRGELTFSGEDAPVTEDTFYGWVTQYVSSELQGRGYSYTEDSTADFRVDYVAGSYNINMNENLGPLGGRPATDPSMMDRSRYWSESYKEGLLVLQIYRGRSKKLLWQAEGAVNLSPAQVERVLAGMISRAFRKFPKAGTR